MLLSFVEGIGLALVGTGMATIVSSLFRENKYKA